MGALRYCRPMRRQPRALYLVVFLDALLMFAIVPLLPAYVRDLHLSKTEVGLVVGIYSGAVLVGSVPVGYLAARVGARGLTIFGVALLAVATFGCAFAGGFWALLAARTGQGLSSAVSWTAGMAWLSEASEPNVRGRVLGTAMSFATVGTLVGPVIGGVLGGAYGLRTPFILLGLVTVVLTLVVARAPAGPPAPAPVGVGDLVRAVVDASLDDQGEVETDDVQELGDDRHEIELEGVVLSVDTTNRTLGVSADDDDESGQSVLVHVPDAIDIAAFQTGQEVELTVTRTADGYLLQTAARDADANQANDAGNEQGDDDQGADASGNDGANGHGQDASGDDGADD